MSSSGFLDLPEELQLAILDFTSLADVPKMSCVCRSVHELVESDYFWKALHRRTFPNSIASESVSAGWKLVFRDEIETKVQAFGEWFFLFHKGSLYVVNHVTPEGVCFVFRKSAAPGEFRLLTMSHLYEFSATGVEVTEDPAESKRDIPLDLLPASPKALSPVTDRFSYGHFTFERSGSVSGLNIVHPDGVTTFALEADSNGYVDVAHETIWSRCELGDALMAMLKAACERVQ
jgi:hypothetical protein